MKGQQYWYCVIGPADPTQYREIGADFPLRQHVRETFARFFGDELGQTCSSGWGVTKEQADHISFATCDEKTKQAIIRSYYDEGKPLPRHVRAWELLIEAEGRKDDN